MRRRGEEKEEDHEEEEEEEHEDEEELDWGRGRRATLFHTYLHGRLFRLATEISTTAAGVLYAPKRDMAVCHKLVGWFARTIGRSTARFVWGAPMRPAHRLVFGGWYCCFRVVRSTTGWWRRQ